MHLDLAFESKIGPAALRQLGLLAEQYGFRTIWVQNYSRAPEAFMTAVPLALDSQSIRVGVAVVSPYEMHPAKLANAILTLNEYARGRAALVVTSGGDWTGVVKRRMGHLTPTRETLEMIRTIIDNRVAKYDGEIFQLQGFTTQWRTQPPPAIYAGAHGPKMMDIAARLGDGIMLSDLRPEHFDRFMPIIDGALKANDREPGYPLNNFIAWHVKADREASLWEARRELIIRGWLDPEWIEPYLGPDDIKWVGENHWPFLKAFQKRTGDLEGVPEHISSALVEGLTMSGDMGDIDRHVESLQKYAEAGFTEIVLGIQDDPADSIRMIGEHVLPKVRD